MAPHKKETKSEILFISRCGAFYPYLRYKLDGTGQIILNFHSFEKLHFICFGAATTPEIYEKKQYWHEQQHYSWCTLRRSIGINISDHYLRIYLLIFLLDLFSEGYRRYLTLCLGLSVSQLVCQSVHFCF